MTVNDRCFPFGSVRFKVCFLYSSSYYFISLIRVLTHICLSRFSDFFVCLLFFLSLSKLFFKFYLFCFPLCCFLFMFIFLIFFYFLSTFIVKILLNLLYFLLLYIYFFSLYNCVPFIYHYQYFPFNFQIKLSIFHSFNIPVIICLSSFLRHFS